MFRSLLDRKIVEFIPKTEAGATLRVNVDLAGRFLHGPDVVPVFAGNHSSAWTRSSPTTRWSCSPWSSPSWRIPDIILRKQLDKIKTQKMAEMKMEGLDYDQRMEELEKLEYPKPNREFIYSTFNAFADRHPWVGQENIHPKSIAREMFESFRSFSDYIRDYELQRAEGVLLRHLNSVFKVLAQTVPDAAKNDQVREMELYLATMIRQVDSSLLDEWEKMRDPNYPARRNQGSPPARRGGGRGSDITARHQGLHRRDPQPHLHLPARPGHRRFRSRPSPLSTSRRMPTASPGRAERLQQALEAYHADHERICLDPNARNARHTYVTPSEDKKTWRVQQMLVDPEGHNDWVAEFEVDLGESRKTGDPVMKLRRLGTLGAD